MRPSRTATACTWWRASTTSPRVTSTTIGCTAAEPRRPARGTTLRACPSCPRWRRGCASSTRSSPAPRSSRRGPAHVATLKTFDPPTTRARGPLVRGSPAAGQEPALPHGRRRARAPRAPDERRPPALPRGRQEGPKKPMFRAAFADGGELVLTEAGKKKRAGVWLLTPAGARRRARAPRSRRARPRRGDARARSSRASAVSSIRSSATSARSRASAAPTRTRSSGMRGSRRSGSRPTSRRSEVETLAAAIRRRPRTRARAPPCRQGRRRRLPGARPVRRAVPALRRDRSGASTSRSTRSRTAPPARPGDGC